MDQQELCSYFENKIKAKLNITEQWARRVYTGPPEGLEAFVAVARDETLKAIGQAIGQANPDYFLEKPLVVSNQN